MDSAPRKSLLIVSSDPESITMQIELVRGIEPGNFVKAIPSGNPHIVRRGVYLGINFGVGQPTAAVMPIDGEDPIFFCNVNEIATIPDDKLSPDQLEFAEQIRQILPEAA